MMLKKDNTVQKEGCMGLGWLYSNSQNQQHSQPAWTRGESPGVRPPDFFLYTIHGTAKYWKRYSSSSSRPQAAQRKYIH